MVKGVVWMKQTMSLRKAYEWIKGQTLRYVLWMLVFVGGSALFANQDLLSVVYMDYPLLSLPYLFVLLALVIGRNTLIAALLKRVRQEEFTKTDVTLSIKKTGWYLLSRLLMFGIDLTLLIFFTLLYQIIGLWSLPLYQIASVMTLSIEAFMIFAIHDGMKNALQLLRHSLHLWSCHCGEIASASFFMMAWTLLFMILQNALVALLVQGANVSEWEMLKMAWNSESLFAYVLAYIALQVVNVVITAIILVPTYLLYAHIYELERSPYASDSLHFEAIEMDDVDQDIS